MLERFAGPDMTVHRHSHVAVGRPTGFVAKAATLPPAMKDDDGYHRPNAAVPCKLVTL